MNGPWHSAGVGIFDELPQCKWVYSMSLPAFPEHIDACVGGTRMPVARNKHAAFIGLNTAHMTMPAALSSWWLHMNLPMETLTEVVYHLRDCLTVGIAVRHFPCPYCGATHVDLL